MFIELRRHMKITVSIVLVSVIALIMVAAIYTEKLLSNAGYATKSKAAIMADAYDAYVQAEPVGTGESYRVGKSIINISYQTDL